MKTNHLNHLTIHLYSLIGLLYAVQGTAMDFIVSAIVAGAMVPTI